jgi:hypothetical protein
MVDTLLSTCYCGVEINVNDLLVTEGLAIYKTYNLKQTNEVRSTIPLPFSADRAGVHLAIIEIDFQITQRNDIDKRL